MADAYRTAGKDTAFLPTDEMILESIIDFLQVDS